jgi:hypothetical protein
VKRWHMFTGMDEGSTNGVDDDDPILALAINVSLPTPEFGDHYVHASVMLFHCNLIAQSTVIGCKHDDHGNAIGRANNNPILDLRVYRMEFHGGNVNELTVNVIAESMYALCNKDGNEYLLMDTFVNHKSNALAVSKDDQRMVHRVCISLHCVTAGWHLCIQWKDGSTSWQPLKDLKEAYPLAVAKFAVAQGIGNELVFNW